MPFNQNVESMDHMFTGSSYTTNIKEQINLERKTL